MVAKKVRLLTFDPAMGVAGWAVIDYDPVTRVRLVVKKGELTPNKIIDRAANREETDQFGKRLPSLKLVREMVRELFLEYKPDYVVTEGIFCNPKRITAYTALLQWLTTVELMLYMEFRVILYHVPTKIAKQAVTGSGGSGKLLVQDAVLSHPMIEFKKPPEILHEHEADAIAVGFGFIESVLPALQVAPSVI